MTIAALVLLAAYLVGSFSGSLLLGRLRGVDIRTMGSGNAGGTNAFRTQGAAFALGVVAIDIGKGAFSAWLGTRYATDAQAWLPYAATLAAALGHVWPVWHGFRGGKGAATLVGGALVAWPAAVGWLLGTWVVSLVLTGYVGLSTMLAGVAALVYALATDASPERTGFALAVAVLLVFTHRANIVRLRAGTESRFEKARLLHRLLKRA
jgi:glycerol-3-phosphate acyltransferase PlsY